MNKFPIIESSPIEVREDPDGTQSIHTGYWLMQRANGTSIEFAGSPWQEGLTQEDVDAIRVGGYSISELQELVK